MKTLEQFLDDTAALSREECLSRRDAEWRRLVEEARAERDKERAAHDFAADVLKTVQDERDRLKGELAEARRLISEAFPNVRDDGLSAKLRAFVTVWPSAAATPAEQAQGEGAKPKVSQSKYPCQFDSEGRCEWHVHDDKPLMLAVAALAKRLDGLEVDLSRLAQDSATQNAMAEAQNKLAKLDDWSYRIVGEFLKWQARLAALEHPAAAPPPPEAAGPGADDEAVVREIAGRHYDGARSFAVMWQAMQAAVREAYAAVPAAEREACIAIARDGLDGASPCAAIADAIARRGGK
jgi:hypothetical protein